jgi:phage terminase small subunit
MSSQKKPTKKKQPNGRGHDPAKLTAKQERFCSEWILDMNDTQAAIRSGYSKKTASAIGHELLRNPKIRAEIDRLRHAALIRNDLKLDDLIQEMKHFGFYSIADFLDTGNEVMDLSQMSRELLKPVTGIKITTTYSEGGDPTTTELKMVDKRAAVVDLIRYLGGFEKDNRQKGLKIIVKRK